MQNCNKLSTLLHIVICSSNCIGTFVGVDVNASRHMTSIVAFCHGNKQYHSYVTLIKVLLVIARFLYCQNATLYDFSLYDSYTYSLNHKTELTGYEPKLSWCDVL